MKKTEVSMQEIWEATKPKIQKSKKTYSRKGKAKPKPEKDVDEN